MNQSSLNIFKTCNKCNIQQPILNFIKQNTSLDGYAGHCKECNRIIDKKHREKNKDNINKLKKLKRKLRKQNPELRIKELKTTREYHKKRRQNDVNFKIKTYLRSRLNRALICGYKAGSTVRDLGCTIDFFKGYIEAKFLPDMSWENWGTGENHWQLDHIVPLAAFDLTDRDQFLSACHYTNYQPLWAIDNNKKNANF